MANINNLADLFISQKFSETCPVPSDYVILVCDTDVKMTRMYSIILSCLLAFLLPNKELKTVGQSKLTEYNLDSLIVLRNNPGMRHPS